MTTRTQDTKDDRNPASLLTRNFPEGNPKAVSADFRKNLQETIAWCIPRVNVSNPKYCLRSAQLKPNYEFSSRPGEDVDLWADIQMIDDVVKSRARLSSAGKNAIGERDIDLAGGRLLIHFLYESNHNGATADITSYYLDHNDTPPWDTWVQALVPESFAHQAPDAIPSEYPFLISWVPSEFLTAVNEATEAECVGMLMWADALRRWETPPRLAESVPLWLQQLSK